MAQKYKIKLLEKKEVAEGTFAFKFEKPEGFTFKAGQTLDWTLIDPKETDNEGTSRTFSIAASPEENFLMFTTRIRNTAFKRQIKEFSPDDQIEIEGPFGSFNLHNDSGKPAVFLCGGIGITPFFSIIKDATARKLDHKIFLFYSNRRPEDSAFLQDLIDLETQNPNFKLISTMTEIERSSAEWQGETGYITFDMIKKHISDTNNCIFYIAGPPMMVVSMNEMLQHAGIDTDNIKFEEFAGY